MTTDQIIHEANGMDTSSAMAVSAVLDLIIALAHENARLEARIESLESLVSRANITVPIGSAD